MRRLAPVLLIEMQLPGKQQQLRILGVLLTQRGNDFQGILITAGIGIGQGRFPTQVALDELPP